MIYEEVKEMKVKFEAFVGSFIEAHPLQSYREIGVAVGLPMWRIAAIAKQSGIRRLGGHPGRRPWAKKDEKVDGQA